MQRSVSGLRWLVAGIAIGVVGIGVAHAAIPDADGDITACVNRLGGVRIIDTETGQACSRFEQMLEWNQQGPAGPPGPPGPAGPPGASSASVVVASNLGTDGGWNNSASNFVESEPFGNPPGDHDVATRFQVPSSGPGFRLDQFVIAVGDASGPLDVYLVGESPCSSGVCTSADGFAPDMNNVLEVWHRSGPSGTTFESATQPTLVAGSAYWIVATIPEDATGRWRWWSGLLALDTFGKAERYDCCFDHLWVSNVGSITAGPGYQVKGTAL
jgi:hypothetical protein